MREGKTNPHGEERRTIPPYSQRKWPSLLGRKGRRKEEKKEGMREGKTNPHGEEMRTIPPYSQRKWPALLPSGAIPPPSPGQFHLPSSVAVV